MLSFDITDRNIRIVKGVEGNGKIKISSAATLDLEEDVIVNGRVNDVPRVATLINGILKQSKMADREAIVSISSNLTIFREIKVAKTKGMDVQKAVKQQMEAELNLDDSYCVTYTIVGESEAAAGEGEEGEAAGGTMLNVLATACPYEIVNCYRDVFKMLGITLKSVIIGCNCITKVLLADTKIKSKMPLLAVQIDNNFISLNLYEDSQLSFSRFASIDPSDYGNSADYVFEAVNENIYRMLQFQRSRNTGETVENVVLYGDTHDYVRLTDELSKLELNTSLINVPPQIHGHENLEFSLYANAIGAMFKRNKDTEKINLLEAEGMGVGKKKGGGSELDAARWPKGMIALLLCCAVGVGGFYLYQTIKDNGIIKDTEEYQAKLDSPETAQKLEQYNRLLEMQEKVGTYNIMITNAHDAFYSQPVILGEKYEKLQEIIEATMKEVKITDAKISNPQYSEGTFTFSVEGDCVDEATQKLPAQFVENLLKDDMVANVEYSSYTVQETNERGPEGEAGTVTKRVSFSLTVNIVGESDPYREVTTAAPTQAPTQAAAE